MFQPVEGSVNFPAQELAIGQFWKDHGIYEKSLEQRAGAPSFVFYEGPPTANGMPHPGHCLTRAIKDLFPRYKTMRGYRCERKAGWDTHGLPVEVEVCKELGIHSKEEIEAYGIEPFIHKCQQSVWRYMQEWRRLTERLGFWIHLDEAYVTYHQSYVESVWWSLKNLFDRGLLYQGHKIVWWWAQGGTALSSGEVGQGYREVADPSVYVKFPLLDDDGNVTDTSLLVWTTTPWTLPSNQFVAVHPDLEYVEVDFFRESTTHAASAPGFKSRSFSASSSGAKSHSWSRTDAGAYRRSLHGNEEKTSVIVAKDLVQKLADRFDLVAYQIKNTHSGRDLIGKRFLPPFDATYPESFYTERKDFKGNLRNGTEVYLEWRIVAGQFVTTDTGTGVVHIAPAFGEDDYELLTHERSQFDGQYSNELPILLCAVEPNGRFNSRMFDYLDQWVKDCDKPIIQILKRRGLLFHQEQYRHEYPFCWRAEEDPLIQYPRESWFIKTTSFKDEMLANNAKINWLPEHIKDGRFGKFLESNVDWALSRERYWGTPLPIWKCDKTGQMEAIASYDELLAKPGVRGTEVWQAAKKDNPNLVDDLRVHKPYIDAVTYDSPFVKGARMQRVPEVIDCWYDSGAMPFAQWGYRGTGGSDTSSNGTGNSGTGNSGTGNSGTGNSGTGGSPVSVAAEKFRSQFPADFISEALDQTRGWFYSQLAISTLLFGRESRVESRGPENSGSRLSTLDAQPYPHPFRNCIVLGLMLGEDGQKMSKSKRNYREPNEIFDRYGADALRWFFFANQPPWTTIRYSEQSIKESIPEFLLRLWNVYSFFVIYANIDGFDPQAEGCRMRDAGDRDLNARAFATANSYRAVSERSELDRWILSELHRTAAAVVERMDAYDNFGACQQITEYVDALSNWYVRRSRDRFWAADKRGVEKLDAYWTLYECLVTTAKLIAPFVPYLAETLWQNLARRLGTRDCGSEKQPASRQPPAPSLQPPESVHLCDYPTGNAAVIDEALSARMNLLREIASLGRSARSTSNLKVRQPLAKVEVVLADTTHQPWLEEHAGLIADELNVKAVEFTTHGEQYISYSVVPNFKRLGPRLGKHMPAAKKRLGEIDAATILNDLKSAGKFALTLPDGATFDLDNEDIEVRLQAKPGWAAAQGKGCVVVLATELTPELIAEGLARDVVRLIQDQRKEIGCEYTDRIDVGLVTSSAELAAAIESFRDYIAQETLANRVIATPIEEVKPISATLSGHELAIYVRVVT